VKELKKPKDKQVYQNSITTIIIAKRHTQEEAEKCRSKSDARKKEFQAVEVEAKEERISRSQIQADAIKKRTKNGKLKQLKRRSKKNKT